MAIERWIVLATVAGPVIAVQTQKWIERASERGRRRPWIFTALMANRATYDDFIRALHLIDLEFAGKRFGSAADRKVIEAWRHFSANSETDHLKISGFTFGAGWNTRVSDRLVDLLSAMSTALGYTFFAAAFTN